MSKKILYFLTGSFFFFIFVVFSYLVQKQIFVHFDFNTTVRLQNHISRRFDAPFSFLSLVGSIEVTGIFLIIFLIIRRKILSGLVTIFLFGIIHIFELYGKTFVKHPGPPFGFLRYDLGFNFPSAYIQPGSSYPSGHAARAFFVTTIIGVLALSSHRLTKNNKMFIVIALACYDIMMCVSRVYLAEHWTTDIIGGSFSGIGLALMAGIVL